MKIRLTLILNFYLFWEKICNYVHDRSRVIFLQSKCTKMSHD